MTELALFYNWCVLPRSNSEWIRYPNLPQSDSLTTPSELILLIRSMKHIHCSKDSSPTAENGERSIRVQPINEMPAYSTVTFYLGESHRTAGKEEQHSDSLPMLSTMQFSRHLIKPRSRQCKNSQSPCAFQLHQFGDAWRGPLDLLSSICTGFPTAWQRSNGKFELVDQSNYLDT
jgi:hypothetical protein